VRSWISRGVRLALVVGTGMALAAPVLAAAVLPATQTRLEATSSIVNGHTQGSFSVSVVDNAGQPATGAVVLEDNGKPLAGAALDAKGTASITADLAGGAHSFEAVYQGNATHAQSASAETDVTADATSTGTPDFQIAVSPASISLTQGQSGEITVSLTPVDASALPAPMFVTLSCSGYPDQSSCNFTPENVEIQQGATAVVTSDMVITTQATGTRGSTTSQLVHPGKGNGVALAILLPGALGLAAFGFSTRKTWLRRLSLLALLALVTTLGTTACSPLYDYYNHGPLYNLPTPAGTYTVKITAQSSDGVTATSHSTTVALTVTAASTTSSSSTSSTSSAQ
jgi:hypothetical protein